MICQECEAEFNPKRADQHFCSTKCRKDFNNRRAMRGALLYDAVYAWRTERGLDANEDFDALSESEARKIVWDLMRNWRQEDFQERDGRSPVLDIRIWVKNNPWIKSLSNVFDWRKTK